MEQNNTSARVNGSDHDNTNVKQNENIIGWYDNKTPRNNLGLWNNLQIHQSYKTVQNESDAHLEDAVSSTSKGLPNVTAKCSTETDFIELTSTSESSSDNCKPTSTQRTSSTSTYSMESSDSSESSLSLNSNFQTQNPFLGLAGAGALDLNINNQSKPSTSNYNGKSVNQSMTEHDYVPNGFASWIPENKKYSRGVIGLHEEIIDFYNYIKPTVQEVQMRQHVIFKLEQITKSKWPLAAVDVFGSFMTGLYLPTSDIDIVITGKWRKFPLYSMADELVRNRITKEKNVTILSNATIPIVKYIDTETNLKVDISFNVLDSKNGFTYINDFKNKFPNLEKLVLLLKLFLTNRKMNETFSGGLSSYCLTMLVVNFFQLHERSDANSPQANLGVLLLEFLELYGFQFNYDQVGIRIKDNGAYVPKDRLRREMGSKSTSLLCIEDPGCSTNELAKSSFCMKYIQFAFQSAFARLNYECGFGGISRSKQSSYSPLSYIIRIPPEMLEFRESIGKAYASMSALPFTSNHHINNVPNAHKGNNQFNQDKKPRPTTSTQSNHHSNNNKYNHGVNLSLTHARFMSKLDIFDNELISLSSSDSEQEVIHVSDKDEEDVNDSKVQLIKSTNCKKRKN